MVYKRRGFLVTFFFFSCKQHVHVMQLDMCKGFFKRNSTCFTFGLDAVLPMLSQSAMMENCHLNVLIFAPFFMVNFVH